MNREETQTYIYTGIHSPPNSTRTQAATQYCGWFLLYTCGLATKLCPTPCDPMDCSPPASSIHRISQERIPGVGCHFLLLGIFLTQGLNLHLLHCQQSVALQEDSLPTEPQEKPILYIYIYIYIFFFFPLCWVFTAAWVFLCLQRVGATL